LLASGRGKPLAKLTPLNAFSGRNRWRVSADRRSHPPTIAQCLNGGYRWLEVESHRCKTRASLPFDAIRRPRDAQIWKLEPALKCRSCRTPRYSPPVHMIKLTQEREIAPYVWVHLDDER
jgi:hypothetical protein